MNEKKDGGRAGMEFKENKTEGRWGHTGLAMLAQIDKKDTGKKARLN